MNEALQREMARTDRGRVMAADSAYHVFPENRGRDVIVNASYCGVLPARFLGAQAPRGAIGVDCGVGPAGASIAGLWYLEALNIPAAVADVMTVQLGNGVDLYDRGVISFVNRPAQDCGVQAGMKVSEAAMLMLIADPASPDAAEVTNRTLVDTSPSGRKIFCTDSIAFGLPEDVENVLVTAGHTGRSAVPYLLKVRPFGFICSDGGGGRDASGRLGLEMVENAGLAGATVDARLARMGDALSSYHDGIITGANSLARAAGVDIGMSARVAARILAERNIL
ncbi:hypothetical protein [Sphingosinicella microcystinivorans]|uniref:Uncharacterized protein n=1 Tax=Sphingosinicella microcystinivorans TaxID=335406 RepID=A0AAD1D901_SPHMI|nr:hypothetical protein [Sphingosinicella microcystinivorans]RKS86326.1 hypothetical protein DFR51_3029 [Sphingosinicella microcystinivorans]BBE35628.1 hypothetical protein SmB9_32860 [Sphingosinicella microcystinivorans]